VRDHLSNMDAYKSMGPDGIHPQVLGELADVIGEPLFIISLSSFPLAFFKGLNLWKHNWKDVRPPSRKKWHKTTAE